MKSLLEIKRNFFSKSYQIEFSVQCELKPFFISDLTHFCLNSLLPDEALDSSQLLNIKGRDSALIPGGQAQSPKDGELVHLGAELLEANGSSADSFSLGVRTEFLDYPSNTSITHSVRRKKKGDFPDNIPLRALGQAFPLKLSEFRFGIDFFTSRFAVFMLGRTPLVTRTLLIDCSEQSCQIRILASRVKRLRTLPLADWEPFQEFTKHLQEWTVEQVLLDEIYSQEVTQY